MTECVDENSVKERPQPVHPNTRLIKFHSAEPSRSQWSTAYGESLMRFPSLRPIFPRLTGDIGRLRMIVRPPTMAAWFLIGGLLSGSSLEADKPAPWLRDVLRGWRVREARYQSGRVEWSLTTSAQAVAPNGASPEDSESQPSPPVTIVTRGVFEFVDLRGRVDVEVRTESAVPPRDQPRRLITCFDGVERREYRRSVDAAPDAWSLEPRARGLLALHEQPDWAPLAWVFRPLHPGFTTLEPAAFVPQPALVRLGEVHCRVLVAERQDTCSRLWLDPARHDLILRYEVESRGRPRLRYDLEYDNQRPPMLVGWRRVRVRHDDEGLFTSSWGRVLAVTTNRPIAPERFTIPFPAGAIVDVHARDGGRHFIRRDGSMRRITPEERRAGFTPEELENSLSPEELAAARDQRNALMMGTLLGVLVLAALVYAWRNRKPATSGPA